MTIGFPTSVDIFYDKTDNVDDIQAEHINSIQDVIELLETKIGINSSGVTASLDYKINNFFSSGRKVWIYENTAPTGWSIVSTVDNIIGIKGGTEAYNVSGGNTAGTWTQPDHTLTTAEMASHQHGAYWGSSGSNSAYYQLSGSSTGLNTTFTTAIGGGGAHNHGTTYRPAACVGIVISKS